MRFVICWFTISPVGEDAIQRREEEERTPFVAMGNNLDEVNYFLPM